MVSYIIIPQDYIQLFPLFTLCISVNNKSVDYFRIAEDGKKWKNL